MLAWARRHPVVTWSLAWAAAGTGLSVADVFSKPRLGPLWPALVVGSLAWGIAGAVTRYARRRELSAIAWAVAYLIALWLSATLRTWLDENRIAPGFVGMLLGWAIGGGLGALGALYLGAQSPRTGRSIAFGLTWGLSFFTGGYLGLVAAMLLGQVAKAMLQPLGNPQMALRIGWAVGCALGGAIAAAIGVAAGRWLLGSQWETSAT